MPERSSLLLIALVIARTANGLGSGSLPPQPPPAPSPTPVPYPATTSSSDGEHSSAHPAGLIAGVAFAAVSVLVLGFAFVAIYYGKRRVKGKADERSGAPGAPLAYLGADRSAAASPDEEAAEAPGFAYFAAGALSAATASFSVKHLIGKLSPAAASPAAVGYCGGGDAYVGWLPQGVIGNDPQGRNVAVWRLAWSGQYPQEATDASDAGGLTHVDATARRLAALRHRHLLPLVGSCPDLPMLVYDLGPREEADFTVPLADIMQPPPAGFPATQLGWQARVKVCADVAAAIIFLQERTPPVFCGVPLDVGRVVVDMGTGDARLGFVGLGAFTSSGPVALGHEASPPPDVTSAREMEDVRALGVLLLRLLLGNVSGDADELVGWVRGVMQYERGDGGVGQALAGLALAGAARGGGGIEWPPEVTLFFAEMALRCASCSLQGGVPNLRFEVLPHLHQLRNHQRLPIAGACQPAILHSPHGQGGQAIQGQPQQAPTPQGRCWGD